MYVCKDGCMDGWMLFVVCFSAQVHCMASGLCIAHHRWGRRQLEVDVCTDERMYVCMYVRMDVCMDGCCLLCAFPRKYRAWLLVFVSCIIGGEDVTWKQMYVRMGYTRHKQVVRPTLWDLEVD